MNDETDDLFPTETRRLSERFTRPPVADLAALEAELRQAEPGDAVPVDDILAQRNAIHGDFTDDAQTAQALKYVMHQSKNWDSLPPFAREALEQMQTKVACASWPGDWRHPDHWKDLQGYPRLVEQRL